MINWKSFANLQVFSKLLLKKNAVIRVENSDGSYTDVGGTELSNLDGLSDELAAVSGLTATAAEINGVADVSARVQELTATGSVTANVTMVELNHASTPVAATIADAANHAGVPFTVRNTSASGTAAHTLTLTSGTFDGTNNVATLNAPGESLTVVFDSSGNGLVLVNTGAVALS